MKLWLKHKSMFIVSIVVTFVLVGWSLVSYFFNSSVASPNYTVFGQKDGYEVRLYDSFITAEVSVKGSYNETLNQGFRILANYIFGNNTKQEEFAMTVPVLEKMAMIAPVMVQDGEVLDMTAPVLERGDDTIRTISFVLPLEYTLETLPHPNNSDITIVQQEAQKIAALKFSWFRNAKRVARKKKELQAMLSRDAITVRGVPAYAGYNAPLSAPWLNRHEIMMEIE